MKFDVDNIASQQGRVAIVTGANNGVGFETTAGLATVGATVVMACRNLGKAENARASLLARIPDADLHIIELDLSRQESVRDFANRFRKEFERLDVLVNNAGVLVYSGARNEAGIELQFATNHLGHFTLTAVLLDMMPDTSSSRVVSLSSIAHKQGRIDFDDINCGHQSDKGFAYAQSKLACLMFAGELNRRLKKAGKKIVSNCAHPGGTDSGLFGEMSRIQYFTLKALAPFITHSNTRAALPSLVAALSDDMKGDDYIGPQGFMDLKGPPGIAKRTEYSKDKAVAKRLWEVSEQMTNTPFVIGQGTSP